MPTKKTAPAKKAAKPKLKRRSPAKPEGGEGSALRKRARKDGRPFNPASARRLLQMQKELKILDLRLEGLSFDEIGARMGIPMITAYATIMRLLDRYEGELAEKVEQARHEEIERNRKLLRYLSAKVKKGDVKAITAAVKISERISRLRGLDTPVEQKHVHEGALTVDAFREMIKNESAAPTDGEEKAGE